MKTNRNFKRRAKSSTPTQKVVASTLSFLIAFSPTMSLAIETNALPTYSNGELSSFSSGVTKIDTDTNKMTVTSSGKAFVNWDSFNVGSLASVEFAQGATDVILNKVDANNGSSTINGDITSAGYVFIVNNAGVLFGADSSVDVAGLLATSSDISTENWDSAATSFNFTTGNNAGAVEVAQGAKIEVGNNGFVVLMAPVVTNAGTITAPAGYVGLVSADKATLNLTDSGFVSLSLTKGTNTVDSSTITNSGKIEEANHVVLSNSQMAALTSSVINNEGTIEVSSISDLYDNTAETKIETTETAATTSSATLVEGAGKVEIDTGGTFENSGSINLEASTGAWTVESDTYTYDTTASVEAGNVDIKAGDVLLEADSDISAHDVAIKISDDVINNATHTNVGRIDLSAGSSINASGSVSIATASSDTSVNATLNNSGSIKATETITLTSKDSATLSKTSEIEAENVTILAGTASSATTGNVVQDGTVTATDTLTITAEKSIYGEGTMTADKAVLTAKAGDVGYVNYGISDRGAVEITTSALNTSFNELTVKTTSGTFKPYENEGSMTDADKNAEYSVGNVYINNSSAGDLKLDINTFDSSDKSVVTANITNNNGGINGDIKASIVSLLAYGDVILGSETSTGTSMNMLDITLHSIGGDTTVDDIIKVYNSSESLILTGISATYADSIIIEQSKLSNQNTDSDILLLGSVSAKDATLSIDIKDGSLLAFDYSTDASKYSLLNAKNINLSAEGAIGSYGTYAYTYTDKDNTEQTGYINSAINVNVDGYLKATSGSTGTYSGIYINSTAALNVDSISAEAGNVNISSIGNIELGNLVDKTGNVSATAGDVELIATGEILAYNANTTISGDSVALTAKDGRISGYQYADDNYTTSTIESIKTNTAKLSLNAEDINIANTTTTLTNLSINTVNSAIVSDDTESFSYDGSTLNATLTSLESLSLDIEKAITLVGISLDLGSADLTISSSEALNIDSDRDTDNTSTIKAGNTFISTSGYLDFNAELTSATNDDIALNLSAHTIYVEADTSSNDLVLNAVSTIGNTDIIQTGNGDMKIVNVAAKAAFVNLTTEGSIFRDDSVETTSVVSQTLSADGNEIKSVDVDSANSTDFMTESEIIVDKDNPLLSTKTVTYKNATISITDANGNTTTKTLSGEDTYEVTYTYTSEYIDPTIITAGEGLIVSAGGSFGNADDASYTNSDALADGFIRTAVNEYYKITAVDTVAIRNEGVLDLSLDIVGVGDGNLTGNIVVENYGDVAISKIYSNADVTLAVAGEITDANDDDNTYNIDYVQTNNSGYNTAFVGTVNLKADNLNVNSTYDIDQSLITEGDIISTDYATSAFGIKDKQIELEVNNANIAIASTRSSTANSGVYIIQNAKDLNVGNLVSNSDVYITLTGFYDDAAIAYADDANLTFSSITAPSKTVSLSVDGNIIDNRSYANGVYTPIQSVTSKNLIIDAYEIVASDSLKTALDSTEYSGINTDVIAISPNLRSDTSSVIENDSPIVLDAITLKNSTNLSLTAPDITIDYLSGSADISGAVSITTDLILKATDGNITFADIEDLIVTTGKISLTAEIADENYNIYEDGMKGMIVVGNLTANGDVTLTAEKHISIGTLTSNNGNVSVASKTGYILDNNGDTVNIVAENGTAFLSAYSDTSSNELDKADMVEYYTTLKAKAEALADAIADLKKEYDDYNALYEAAVKNESTTQATYDDLQAQAKALEAEAIALYSTFKSLDIAFQSAQAAVDTADIIAGAAQAIPFSGDLGAATIVASLSLALTIAELARSSAEISYDLKDSEAGDMAVSAAIAESNLYTAKSTTNQYDAILNILDSQILSKEAAKLILDNELLSATSITDAMELLVNTNNGIGTTSQALGVNAKNLTITNTQASATDNANIYIKLYGDTNLSDIKTLDNNSNVATGTVIEISSLSNINIAGELLSSENVVLVAEGAINDDDGSITTDTLFASAASIGDLDNPVETTVNNAVLKASVGGANIANTSDVDLVIDDAKLLYNTSTDTANKNSVAAATKFVGNATSGGDVIGGVNAVGDITVTTESSTGTSNLIINKAITSTAIDKKVVLASDGAIIGDAEESGNLVSGGNLEASSANGIYAKDSDGTISSLKTDVFSLVGSATDKGDILIEEAYGIELKDVYVKDGRVDVLAGENITATKVLVSSNTDADDIDQYAEGADVDSDIDTIKIETTKGDITVGTITANGLDLSLTATGEIKDDDTSVNADTTSISARNLTLSAGTGIGNDSTSTDAINTAIDTNIDVLKVETASGDVNISEANKLTVKAMDVAGDVSIANKAGSDGYLYIESIKTASDKTVTLIANEAIVSNANDGEAMVEAKALSMQAGAGTGITLNPINVKVSNLEASVSGDIYLNDLTGDLEVGGVTRASGYGELTGITTSTTGNLVLNVVEGSLTVSEAINVVEEAELTAKTNISNTAAITAGDDLTMTATDGAITVSQALTSTSGSADLTAGTSITSNATIEASKYVDMLAATSIETNADIEAGTYVEMTATAESIETTGEVVANDGSVEMTANKNVSISKAVAATGTSTGVEGDVIITAETGVITTTGDGAITADNDVEMTAKTNITAGATVEAANGSVEMTAETGAISTTAELTAGGSVGNPNADDIENAIANELQAEYKAELETTLDFDDLTVAEMETVDAEVATQVQTKVDDGTYANATKAELEAEGYTEGSVAYKALYDSYYAAVKSIDEVNILETEKQNALDTKITNEVIAYTATDEYTTALTAGVEQMTYDLSYGEGAVTMTAGNGITTSATVKSTNSDVNFEATTGDITINGAVEATKGAVSITAGTLDSTTVALTAGGSINTTAAITAGKNVAMAAYENIETSGIVKANGGSIAMTAYTGDTAGTDGITINKALEATGDILISSSELADATSGVKEVAPTTANEADVNINANVVAGGAVKIETDDNLNTATGVEITSAKTTTLEAQEAMNLAGKVSATKNIIILAGSDIIATDDLKTTDGFVKIVASGDESDITISKAIDANKDNDLTNDEADTTEPDLDLIAGDVYISAGASITANAGATIEADLDVDMDAGTSISTSDTVKALGGDVDMTALTGDIKINKAVQASANVEITAEAGSVETETTDGTLASTTAGNVVVKAEKSTITIGADVSTKSGYVEMISEDGTYINADIDANGTTGSVVLKATDGNILTANDGSSLETSTISADTFVSMQAEESISLGKTSNITADITAGDYVDMKAGTSIVVAADADIKASGSLDTTDAQVGSVTMEAGTEIKTVAEIISEKANVEMTALDGKISIQEAGETYGIKAGNDITLTSSLDVDSTNDAYISVSDTLDAGNDIIITANADKITTEKTVTAGSDLTMTAYTNITTEDDVIATTGSVEMTSTNEGNININDLVKANKNIDITTTNGSVTTYTTTGTLTADTGNITITAKEADADPATSDITIGADVLASKGYVEMTAVDNISINDSITATESYVKLNSSTGNISSNAAGSITAGTEVDMDAYVAISTNDTVTANGGDVDMTALTSDITINDAVQASANVEIIAGTLDSATGALTTGGSIITGTAGSITAGKAVDMDAYVAITTNDTVTANGGDVDMTALTSDIKINDAVQASNDINANAKAGSVATTAGGTLNATNNIDLDAGTSISIADTATAGENVEMTAGTSIETNASVEATAGVDMDAGTGIDINADVTAGTTVTMVAGQNVDVDGVVLAGTGIAITAKDGYVATTESLTSTKNNIVIKAQEKTEANDNTITIGADIKATTGDLTMEAEDSIVIKAIITAGAADGLVSLTATNGSITGSSANSIIAKSLEATSATGIGDSTNSINTTVDSITAETTGTGDIFFDETNAVTLTSVEATAGDITVDAGGAIVATSVKATAGDITVDAGGAIVATSVKATDGSIKMTAGGAITATSVVSSTDSDDNDISLTAEGNINVGEITATGAGDVVLSANNSGSITNIADTSIVNADNLNVTAAGEIDLNTKVATLTAQAGTDVNIDETDAITLTSVEATAGDITVDAGGAIVATSVKATDGYIELTAGGAITATKVVSSTDSDDNDISLTAEGNINVGEITATGAGDVVLSANNSGSITNIADTSIVNADNLNVTAAGEIDLNTKVATLTAQAGTNINIDETDAITLTSVEATAGYITVVADDEIIATSVKATDGYIELTAGGAITATKVVSSTDADDNDISLTAEGNINVGKITATGAGDVVLSANNSGSITNIADTSIVNADNLNVTAAGEIDLNTNVATLTAQAGTNINIDETDAITLTSVEATAGDITVVADDEIIATSVKATDGYIELTAGGDITATSIVSSADIDGNDIALDAQGDINVGTITAGTTNGEVSLSATNGEIIDNNDTTVEVLNITASNIDMLATNGIGVGNAIELSTDTLSAETEDGSIEVATDVDIDLAGIIVGGDNSDLLLNAGGSIVISEEIVSGGDVDLTAGDSIYQNADITVDGDSDLSVKAGNSIVADADATTKGDAGDLSYEAPYIKLPTIIQSKLEGDFSLVIIQGDNIDLGNNPVIDADFVEIYSSSLTKISQVEGLFEDKLDSYKGLWLNDNLIGGLLSIDSTFVKESNPMKSSKGDLGYNLLYLNADYNKLPISNNAIYGDDGFKKIEGENDNDSWDFAPQSQRDEEDEEDMDINPAAQASLN